MTSFTSSMNMAFGEVAGAHVMKKVNLGLVAFDTLCLICHELNVNTSKIDDSDFDSASIALDAFAKSANEETGYTVSVWFD